uniref:Uncharacterized protein n=1 Tax=Anguilla anguilla TaxID=7936 RepID=A0A0E9TCS0_ANGAN
MESNIVFSNCTTQGVRIQRIARVQNGSLCHFTTILKWYILR